MRHPYPRRRLLRLSQQGIQLFLGLLAGSTVVYVLALTLKLSPLADLMVILLERVLSRLGVMVLCLSAIAAIRESLRA
jgi:hypothetical protein